MKKRNGFSYIDAIFGLLLISLSFVAILNVYNRSNDFTNNIYSQQQISDLSISIVETLKSEIKNNIEISDYEFTNLPKDCNVMIQKDFVYDSPIYIIDLKLSINNQNYETSLILHEWEVLND